MRFPLDLAWVGRDGRAVRVDHAVPPWRLRGCRDAVAVLELPGGVAARLRVRPGSPVC
jgi:uncharacterized membrane protein (UPF0127 family)